MKCIVVDDEPIMLSAFERASKGIADLNIVGQFEWSQDALEFAENNKIELAFLDIKMPIIDGIELACKLRVINPKIIIVFVSAYDEYLQEFNQIGGDYYIIKPYERETLIMAMEKMRLLNQRHMKRLYIRTFGRFSVSYDGRPLRLSGKAKEILALLVTKRGGEMSNEEIYGIIWENRSLDRISMKVYYNAMKRLRKALSEEGIEELIISTGEGKKINTAMFDCDYYDWLDKNTGSLSKFEGEFLKEYSWGEPTLASIFWEELN